MHVFTRPELSILTHLLLLLKYNNNFVRGDFVQGGFCPGGFCPGIMSGGVCPGDFVLIPVATIRILEFLFIASSQNGSLVI